MGPPGELKMILVPVGLHHGHPSCLSPLSPQSQETRATPTSEKTSPEVRQLVGARPELPPQGKAGSNLSLTAARGERALSRLDLSTPFP